MYRNSAIRILSRTATTNAKSLQPRRCSSSTGLLPKVLYMMDEGSRSITRVIFCGPHFPASHIYTKEHLQSYPFIQVDVVPFDDVPDVIGNYDMCVVKNLRLNSDIISRANQMKLIMQFGVGLEGVDVEAATNRGIKVARIPSDATGNAASCAEMAMYLMLGLLRKQVFIMGFGNIGVQLAKRLKPFGAKIIATKRSWPSHLHNLCKSNASFKANHTYDHLVDEKGSHEDILNFASQADIVVCCLELTSETAGIVDEAFMSSMKNGALLVNVARGGLLDYDAVLNHLKSGRLGGLGIDVAWTEPFDPDDAILQFQNVIITPHVAGVTEYSYRSMAKVVGDVALQLHAGTSFTGIEIVN